MASFSRQVIGGSLRSFATFTFILTMTMQALAQSGTYFQQRVSYDIKVNLDVEHHMLLGQENLTYINHSPDTLRYAWFHLYPNAYKDGRSAFAREEEERGINDFFYTRESERGNIVLDTIKTDNTALRWEYKDGDETEMKVFLPGALAPGDSINFSMNFTIKIPRFLSRLGHDDLHYELTQWYPKIAVYDNKGWHNDGYHVLGEFYGDYGTFNVSITLPENMWVAATGVLTDEEEKSRLNQMVGFTKQLDQQPEEVVKNQLDSLKSVNKQAEEKYHSGRIPLKTISFFAENVHDFAWVCDYRYLVRRTNYATTSIYLFVLPEHYIDWKPADRYARDAVTSMTRWYGDYVYPSLFVVDSYNPQGGMEYNNLVLCAVRDYLGYKLLEEVIFHEIGHQWFYGMLGNNEMDDPWLDEGLTQFCEIRYFKEKYNGNFNDSWIAHTVLGYESTNHTELTKNNLLALSSYNPSLPAASEKAYFYRSRLEFNNVYLRPAFALSMLKYSLGDTVFNVAMRAYYAKNLLHHVTGKSLIAAFNETTHRDWQWYFDEWVYSNKQCDYKAGGLRSHSTSENVYLTTFEVIRADSIVMPLTVEFKTEKGNVIRKQIFADKEVTVIEFSSTDSVVFAQIDPDRSLLESNQRNNSTSWNGMHMSFIYPTESFYQNTLYFTPWFSHNSFGGSGYGGIFLYYDRLPDIYGNESHAFGASTYYFPQTKTFDYAFVFRSTTKFFKEFNDYYLNYHKWQGERKAEAVLEYRLGKYKFEHPSHNFLLFFSSDEIFDERYYDSFQAQRGKDVSLGFRYTVGLDHELSTHQFDLEIQKSLSVWGGEYDYTKVTVEGYNDVPLSRRFSVTDYVSAGMIDGTHPRQAGLFLSPSNRVIYSDFGSFMGHRFFYEPDFVGGLAGYINKNLSGQYLLSNRIDLNINILNSPEGMIEPWFLKAFFEAAKLWKSSNDFQSDRFAFLDAGIGIKLLGLDVAFPLWKNYNIAKDGTNFILQPDNRLALNSVLVRLDLTYYVKLVLEMK